MAQVQLYLTKSQKGFASIGNINPSEDVARHIRDFGPALEILHYDATVPQIFYLIKYLDDGLMLTLIRPLPDSIHDNIAASLFFPSGLKLDVDGFNEIADAVADELLRADNPGAVSLNQLRKVLARELPVDPNKARFVPSTGQTFAYAMTGGDNPSLQDYASQRFFQPEFAKYAGVLLVDASSGTTGREHSRNLSGPLRRMLTVLPPHATPENFQPSIDHATFRYPVLAGEGDVLDIVWRRSGFEPVQQQFTVEKDFSTVPQCDTSAARKIITPASFLVCEPNKRNPIKDYTVKVNGIEISGPTPFEFSQLSNAAVEITAPGYFNYADNVDLAIAQQTVIHLRKQHKSYRFDMPLNTPEPLEPLRIYIKTLKPLHRCPIEGYDIAGGELIEGGEPNKLEYIGKKEKKNNLILIAVAVGALIAGFLIGAFVFGGKKEAAPVEATVEQAEEPAPQAAPIPVPKPEAAPAEAPQAAPAETEAPAPEADKAEQAAPAANLTAADYAKGVEYLDANKKWDREAMQAIPALAGLFDDLNNYDFNRIKTFWAPKLSASKSFAAVVRAVEGSTTKRDPRTGKHAPTYTPEGDNSFGWLAYTYWVDP